jgi:hypothetical protein
MKTSEELYHRARQRGVLTQSSKGAKMQSRGWFYCSEAEEQREIWGRVDGRLQINEELLPVLQENIR